MSGPSPKRVAARHAAMDPFKALQKAIKEVWSKHPDGWYKDLHKGWGEWLRDDDDTAIASIYHEYASAPSEPFSHCDRTAYKYWEKVSKAASRYAGREMYIESINAGKSQYFWRDPE
jgi:hypothetical protein